MFDFNYNRVPSVDTDDINSWCIGMKDTLINVQDTQFTDNSGNAIISIVHRKDAFITSTILSTNVDINDISLKGGLVIRLYLSNMTNDDGVNILNSVFDSPYSE